MIGNHKDTNKYSINLLIVNYLYNFFCHPYNSFLSIFKQLLSICRHDKLLALLFGDKACRSLLLLLTSQAQFPSPSPRNAYSAVALPRPHGRASTLKAQRFAPVLILQGRTAAARAHETRGHAPLSHTSKYREEEAMNRVRTSLCCRAVILSQPLMYGRTACARTHIPFLAAPFGG